MPGLKVAGCLFSTVGFLEVVSSERTRILLYDSNEDLSHASVFTRR